MVSVAARRVEDAAAEAGPPGAAVAAIAAEAGLPPCRRRPPLPPDRLHRSRHDRRAAEPPLAWLFVTFTVTPVRVAVPALNTPPPLPVPAAPPAPPLPTVAEAAVTAGPGRGRLGRRKRRRRCCRYRRRPPRRRWPDSA